MVIVKTDSGLNSLLHQFKKNVEEILQDAVTTDVLDQAVTLIPCGHHLNESTAEKIFKKTQLCPLDRKTFEKYVPCPLLKGVAAITSKNVYDFHQIVVQKFRDIHLFTSGQQAVTFLNCHHIAGVQQEQLSSPMYCPLDQLQSESYAVSYIAQEIVSILEENQTALEKLCHNKPSFYLQIINPKISLDELAKIPFHEILLIQDKERDNGVILYNMYRLMEHTKENWESYKDFHYLKAVPHIIRDYQFFLKVQTLNQVISLEKNFADPYYDLAMLLQKGQHLKAKDGRKVDQFELLVSAFILDPNHAQACLALALQLDQAWGFQDNDKKTILFCQKVIIQALSFYPYNPQLYLNLARTLNFVGKETVKLGVKEMRKSDLLEIFINFYPKDPKIYDIICEQACCLSYSNHQTKIRVLNPKIKQLLLDAIAICPEKGAAYHLFASLLEEGETIQLHDGKKLTKIGCCLKAIHLEPHISVCYATLASIMPPKKPIQLLNGTVMSHEQVTLKARLLSSNFSIETPNIVDQLKRMAQLSLSDTQIEDQAQLLGSTFSQLISQEDFFVLEQFIDRFPQEGRLQLEDKTWKNEREVYQIVIEKHPNQHLPYYKMGLILNNKEVIQILGDKKMDRKAFFLEAIRLSPEYPQAYEALANMLSATEMVTLPGGKKVGKQQLLLEGIRLNTASADLYYALGMCLPAGKSVQMPSKHVWGKMELFLKAIHVDDTHAKSYYAIAEMLSNKGTIFLLNGKKINQLELYLKAVSINPSVESPLKLLTFFTPFLKKQKPLSLADNTTLSFKNFKSQIQGFITYFAKIASDQDEVQKLLSSSPHVKNDIRNFIYSFSDYYLDESKKNG